MSTYPWQNERRVQVLRILAKEQEAGRVASRSLVAQEAGYRSKCGVQRHIKALEDDGAVTLDQFGKARVTAYGMICLAAHEQAKKATT
ncbi:MAG: hypothetical protein IPM06_18690 [Rhizobiales bacterium]|nr:hypothetical protein [Hyphomicrobiales bacterium]